jgi:enediyne biosynthesis protein E7
MRRYTRLPYRNPHPHPHPHPRSRPATATSDVVGTRRLLSTASATTTIPTIGLDEINDMGGFGDVLSLVRNMRQRYGDLVRATGLAKQDFVYVFHPDDIREVFRNEGKHPMGAAPLVWPLRRAYEETATKFPSFLQGEEWRRLRDIVKRDVMSVADARSYLPSLVATAGAAMPHLLEHRARFDDFCSRLAMEMMTAAMFGRRLGMLDGTAEPEDVEYMRQVELSNQLCEALLHRDPASVSAEEWAPMPAAMRSILERGRHHLKRTIEDGFVGEARPYLVRLLARAEAGPEQLAQIATGMLHAGSDTTARTLMNVTYLLARWPDAQRRMREEARDVLGDRPLAAEDVPRLRYHVWFVREMFRVCPPSLGTCRVLPEAVSLRGREIPAWTPLMIYAHPACMDPATFAQPERFLPERYEGEAGETSSPWVHMPFSRGARMCLGARLAEAAFLSFLTELTRSYEVALTPGCPEPRLVPHLTLHLTPTPTFDVVALPRPRCA